MHYEISYLARVKMVETYYLSKLWYVLPFVKLSTGFVSRLEEITQRFIWYPKENLNPVKMNIIKLKCENGGLNLIDVTDKQKAMLFILLLRNKRRSLRGSEIFSHFYAVARRVATIKSVLTSDLPHVYKQFRILELQLKARWLDNSVSLVGQDFLFPSLSTKKVYSLVRRKKENVRDNMKYWVERLGFPLDDVISRLKLINSKFIEGNSRNIHFGLIYRFLHTRSRQAHMFPDSDPNCKFCASRGLQNRETVIHCFLDCPRISNFWVKVERILVKLEPTVSFLDLEKTFGVLLAEKRAQCVSNLVIQLAQKAIWKSRQKLENKDIEVDIWEQFKMQLSFALSRLLKLMGRERFSSFFVEHKIAKLSRYKVALDF